LDQEAWMGCPEWWRVLYQLNKKEQKSVYVWSRKSHYTNFLTALYDRLHDSWSEKVPNRQPREIERPFNILLPVSISSEIYTSWTTLSRRKPLYPATLYLRVTATEFVLRKSLLTLGRYGFILEKERSTAQQVR
jgi:hypothetical protein